MKLSIPEREPVAVIGAVGAALTAVIGILVVFGFPLTEIQSARILAAVGPVGILVVLLLVRPTVTPNGKVVEEATDDGQVIAGEASELVTGQPIRKLGTLDTKAPVRRTAEDLPPDL